MRRSSKGLRKDSSQLAAAIVGLSTEEPSMSPVRAYLSEIGRKGGLKGGHARAAKLSSLKKKQIARRAAQVRWAKKG